MADPFPGRAAWNPITLCFDPVAPLACAKCFGTGKIKLRARGLSGPSCSAKCLDCNGTGKAAP